VEEKITYFESPGEANTGDVLRLVKERAKARGIGRIVLASTKGGTARAALEAFANTDIKLVVVPWQYGFFGQTQPFPQELISELESEGHRVCFGTMLFHTEEFYGSNGPRAIANMLRTFGQGIKVSLEILLMAANGGAVESGEHVIAVAGTVSGADTAIVATAAPSTKLGEFHISEIICKPL
jgi:hypothetical protein